MYDLGLGLLWTAYKQNWLYIVGPFFLNLSIVMASVLHTMWRKLVFWCLSVAFPPHHSPIPASSNFHKMISPCERTRKRIFWSLLDVLDIGKDKDPGWWSMLYDLPREWNLSSLIYKEGQNNRTIIFYKNVQVNCECEEIWNLGYPKCFVWLKPWFFLLGEWESFTYKQLRWSQISS